jgi:hypothetical protein
MTTAELVAKVMAGEHGDFVREAVALIAHELMEAEISAEAGAELGEVSPARVTHRNGYRPRPRETRVSAPSLDSSRQSKNHAGACLGRIPSALTYAASCPHPRARARRVSLKPFEERPGRYLVEGQAWLP